MEALMTVPKLLELGIRENKLGREISGGHRIGCLKLKSKRRYSYQ